MTGDAAESELEVAAARFSLGLQTADTLRALAVRLLEEGRDDEAWLSLTT